MVQCLSFRILFQLHTVVKLPPLAEQKRIVERLQELEPMLDSYNRLEQDESRLVSDLPESLRKSILQYAIQGKLVPQDPNDEPASALLERIRTEKELLIKQGKIKRDKTNSYIYKGADNSYYEKVGEIVKNIDDEIPFDLPEPWSWVRLKDVFHVNPRNVVSDETEASFIPMPMISDGFSNTHTFETRQWSKIKSGFTHFCNGDVGIAKITPCFENRKSVVFDGLVNGIGAGTTELHILRAFVPNTIIAEYVLWFVKTEMFISGGKEQFTGTAGQQRVGKAYIENALFPLPSFTEQKRIVEQIGFVLKRLQLLKR